MILPLVLLAICLPFRNRSNQRRLAVTTVLPSLLLKHDFYALLLVDASPLPTPERDVAAASAYGFGLVTQLVVVAIVIVSLTYRCIRYVHSPPLLLSVDESCDDEENLREGDVVNNARRVNADFVDDSNTGYGDVVDNRHEHEAAMVDSHGQEHVVHVDSNGYLDRNVTDSGDAVDNCTVHGGVMNIRNTVHGHVMNDRSVVDSHSDIEANADIEMGRQIRGTDIWAFYSPFMWL